MRTKATLTKATLTKATVLYANFRFASTASLTLSLARLRRAGDTTSCFTERS